MLGSSKNDVKDEEAVYTIASNKTAHAGTLARTEPSHADYRFVADAGAWSTQCHVRSPLEIL